jgi:DNA polymerase elongation subunit (family B)
MERVFRLFDFNIYSKNPKTYGDDDDSVGEVSTFVVQMFGLDEQGKSACILVENFKPFFYVMVDDSWTISKKNAFLAFIQAKMGKFHENTITDCKIIKRHKLYGFDGGKEHLFVRLEFENIEAFNKAKGLWYGPYLPVDSSGRSDRKLLPNGLQFQNSNTRIYESNIPPLLRFFHLKDISPSGWIALPNKRTIEIKHMERKTNCDYEFIINYEHIIPLNQKETRVPYKICSFDIEASSSHGDFPIPIKSYKKLATNIVEYFEKLVIEITPELCKNLLKQMVLTAFGYASIEGVDVVYPKTKPKDKSVVEALIEKWLVLQVKNMQKDGDFMDSNTIESLFAKQHESEKDGTLDDSEGVDVTADQSTVIDNGPTYNATKVVMPKSYTKKTATIVDIMCDKKFDRDGKLNELNVSLNTVFPKLEGDKVTFIGSTFLKYGSPDPYLNNCIVLNTCTNPNAQDDSNTNTKTEIESYSTERDVLLAWQKLIQKENPDIIIGYNIFGFDYQFMFYRAKENDCLEDFLKLSRNVDEVCAQKDRETLQYKLEESSIKIASGQHDLRFIKMTGRLQVDLYNFFRREENLTSYKLDYVAGHFIGDYCKTVDFDESKKTTTVSTTNMMGLQVGSFVHFEEIGHTVEYYQEGAKFLVTAIHAKDKKFDLKGVNIQPDTSKKTRWCLAKDDCTPKDIFRLANGSAEDRAVVAKYCIQDCNLVHYLMNKVDILTGFIEMAKICSVPMNFLVMRGQGIKLQSFIAKKCREFRTLIPVIEKGDNSEGYEGAIVLPPKCDLYLDNPVACVDYASLYPSSIISENLSHDSKVWTKEYDLAGNFVKATGEMDKEGNFLYDNLPGYEYVDISFDLYRYIRTSPSAAAQKVRCGKKTCRFAQFPNGRRAILPTILQELLAARKSTRKLIPQQTDDFMKNVLDKRQLGYKLTANSLYGGCGAVTSTFYEQDVAAGTTATGRMLLTYAKRIVEECYGDAICETSCGKVVTKAEYIYGDTDSVFFTFNLQTPQGEPIRGKKALEITIELAQEAGHLASSFLKQPHDLEYEKTFMPFCLLSKKRYVGMLYETDPNKCKRKEMGIVLKRRDNAPIVKDIYGGIIDILMKEQNVQKAVEFLKACLQNMVDEKYPMEKLIITKSLRSGYKNPMQIAHKVLADRMTARDPGNKPSSGDRIPFVYIHNTNKNALQGEKIETPSFIVENSLKIDYSFYITNQIMKPVQQVFALVLDKIWLMQEKKAGAPKLKFKMEVNKLKEKWEDPEKFEAKLEELKNKHVKALLFDEYLRVTNNQKVGNQALTSFWGKKV